MTTSLKWISVSLPRALALVCATTLSFGCVAPIDTADVDELAELDALDEQWADDVGSTEQAATVWRYDYSHRDLSNKGFSGNFSLSDFQYSRLDYTGFFGANLRQSRFLGTRGERPTFSYADLYRADFTGAAFVRGDFFGAKMQRADFYGATMAGGTFIDADWTAGKAYGANFRTSDLRGMIANELVAEGSDFSHVEAQDAEFKKAKLIACDLTYGKFHRVRFDGADLSGADLRSANLTDANMCGVTINGGTRTSGAIQTRTKCPLRIQ